MAPRDLVMIPTMTEVPGGRMHATLPPPHTTPQTALERKRKASGTVRACIAISHTTYAGRVPARHCTACLVCLSRDAEGRRRQTGQRRTEKLATATSRGPALALRVPLPPPPLPLSIPPPTPPPVARCRPPTPRLPLLFHPPSRAPPRPDLLILAAAATAVVVGSCRVDRRRRPESSRQPARHGGEERGDVGARDRDRGRRRPGPRVRALGRRLRLLQGRGGHRRTGGAGPPPPPRRRQQQQGHLRRVPLLPQV